MNNINALNSKNHPAKKQSRIHKDQPNGNIDEHQKLNCYANPNSEEKKIHRELHPNLLEWIFG
jgi:hypothetical protein